MKCISCKTKTPIPYEEIGMGKYCQDCLDREMQIWEMESGWHNHPDNNEEEEIRWEK